MFDENNRVSPAAVVGEPPGPGRVELAGNELFPAERAAKAPNAAFGRGSNPS